jgi:hypothetical protein
MQFAVELLKVEEFVDALVMRGTLFCREGKVRTCGPFRTQAALGAST